MELPILKQLRQIEKLNREAQRYREEGEELREEGERLWEEIEQEERRLQLVLEQLEQLLGESRKGKGGPVVGEKPPGEGFWEQVQRKREELLEGHRHRWKWLEELKRGGVLLVGMGAPLVKLLARGGRILEPALAAGVVLGIWAYRKERGEAYRRLVTMREYRNLMAQSVAHLKRFREFLPNWIELFRQIKKGVEEVNRGLELLWEQWQREGEPELLARQQLLWGYLDYLEGLVGEGLSLSEQFPSPEESVKSWDPLFRRLEELLEKVAQVRGEVEELMAHRLQQQ